MSIKSVEGTPPRCALGRRSSARLGCREIPVWLRPAELRGASAWFSGRWMMVFDQFANECTWQGMKQVRSCCFAGSPASRWGERGRSAAIDRSPSRARAAGSVVVAQITEYRFNSREALGVLIATLGTVGTLAHGFEQAAGR